MSVISKKILFLLSIILMMFQVVCSCSSDDEAEPDNPNVTPDVIPLYNALGQVTDVSGNTVSFARIDTNASQFNDIPLMESSSQGIFLGDLGSATNQWLLVTANGYAPNYVRSAGLINDVHIFSTKLVPVGSWGQFNLGDTNTISHDSVTVNLSADLFEKDGVVVEVTDMKQVTSGAGYALTASNEYLKFRRVFVITARDSELKNVSIPVGKTMSVQVTLPEVVSIVPALYYFDMTTGRWQTIVNACVLTDETHVQCELPHLSVFSFDGDAQADSLPYPVPDSESESIENIDHALAILEQAEAGNGNVTDAETLLILAVELDSAQASEYALENMNEKGKMRLMRAIATRAMVFLSSDSLKSEALNIAELIADEFLADDSCGKIEEMKAVIAQLEMLDSESESIEKLAIKIQIVRDTCDPWIGKISVKFLRTTAWAGEGGFIEFAAPQWSEQHDVLLEIDPLSATGNPPAYTLTGEDNVLLFMHEAIYEKHFVGNCGLTRTQLKLYSDPQVTFKSLSITGAYDSENAEFSFYSISNSIANLMFSMATYTFTSDCIPYVIPATPIPYILGYGSIIGDLSIDYNKRVRLEDMLNNGYKYSNSFQDRIRGGFVKPISIAYSIPWSVVYLVDVQWEFVHMKQQEEN